MLPGYRFELGECTVRPQGPMTFKDEIRRKPRGARGDGIAHIVRVLRTRYAPAGRGQKYHHPAHVVFYVPEGAGVRQGDLKGRVTPKRTSDHAVSSAGLGAFSGSNDNCRHSHPHRQA